jgi:hypothetical protein
MLGILELAYCSLKNLIIPCFENAFFRAPFPLKEKAEENRGREFVGVS